MKKNSLALLICWATLTAFGRHTPPLTKDQVWQSFRQRFPFHIQTIGQSPRQPDGGYFLLISEPPPHVTMESIRAVFKGHNVLLEEKKDSLGYDGWTKDVLIEVKKASAVEMDTFYHRLYRHLFFIEPHGIPLDLSIREESIYFSKDTLNYEVRNVDLNDWLLSENALGFVPLHEREAASQLLAEVLEKKQTGVWATKEPILMAWILPYAANLTGKESEIREFAENIDFIIGAIRLGDCVAIIAHKKTVPESVLPTMRTETILSLAAAPAFGLGQSYERNFVLAGRMEKNFDGAPIYLSSSLQNTDFGSLLNIADQMLKSWSLNDTIKYINFNHPKPEKWAFPRPLNQVLNSSKITFNGNMEGATQSFDLSNQTYKNLSIVNVSRTGAMAITYMPENIHPDTVRIYEEKAWRYFANLHSPIWAQTVRYAALFQFFKDFGIQANTNSALKNKALDVSILQNESFHLLRALDSLDEKGISKLASKYLDKNNQTKLIEQLMTLKKKISKIKKEGGMPGLRKWADLIGNPWALREYQTEALDKETKDFMEEIAELKSNLMLFELLGVNVSRILKKYSQQNTATSGIWMKTPTMVVSYNANSKSSWSGGHNINVLRPSIKVGKIANLVEIQSNFGQIKIVIDASVSARMTPEVMRRFDLLLIDADDFDSIEEEMRSILLNAPVMASRSCESVLPSAKW